MTEEDTISKTELTRIQREHATLEAIESLHEVVDRVNEAHQCLRLLSDSNPDLIDRIDAVQRELQSIHDAADEEWTQRHLRKSMESVEQAEKYALSKDDV